MDSKFVIKIGNNSIRHFLTKKYLNERKQKRVSKVQAFDFDIEYKKWKMNVVADALSRNPSLSLMKFLVDWKDQLVVE